MITLSITTHNRPEMTIKAFEKVIDNPQVSEILIVDDRSNTKSLLKLDSLIRHLKDSSKIHLHVNYKNLGCYHNKRKAVEKASNDWVILFDSDNIIDNDYISAVINCAWYDNIIYAPEFARPHFDYRGFTREIITCDTVKHWAKQNQFDCLINTCNYFVNRDRYLAAWEDHPEPWTADTLFHNYNHLKNGGCIKVVEGMQYDHLVHNGSHYQEHVDKGEGMRKEYMKKIVEL